MARERSEYERSAGLVEGFMRPFAQAVFDQGGNDDDIRRVVSDAGLRADVARLVVGPIWQLTQEKASLEIDWDKDLPDVLFDCGGEISTRDFSRSGWAESRPSQPVNYLLTHFHHPLPIASLPPWQWAGTRELLAYCMAIKRRLEELSHFAILAPGSSFEWQRHVGTTGTGLPLNEVGIAYPAIYGGRDFGLCSLSGKSFSKEESIPPSFFLLVRVPA